MNEHQALQQLLRSIRKESGLSQKEVAFRLGKPQSYVSKYESGERRLDIVELRHVCHAIEISFVRFTERFEAILEGLDNAS